MEVLCAFHWWPHKEGVNLLHETQRWSVLTFFEFQNNGGEGKNVSIKYLKSDEDGEYFSNEITKYLKERGIQNKNACSYSPN
jgi:hypothetical protein